MIEVRWHARAGQGAKTAAQLLAEAMLRAGKSVQAFPEYGPERRGAPLRAYTRIDDRPIRRHDAVTQPDVVVLDPSVPADSPGAETGHGLANGKAQALLRALDREGVHACERAKRYLEWQLATPEFVASASQAPTSAR